MSPLLIWLLTIPGALLVLPLLSVATGLVRARLMPIVPPERQTFQHHFIIPTTKRPHKPATEPKRFADLTPERREEILRRNSDRRRQRKEDGLWVGCEQQRTADITRCPNCAEKHRKADRLNPAQRQPAKPSRNTAATKRRIRCATLTRHRRQ